MDPAATSHGGPAAPCASEEPSAGAVDDDDSEQFRRLYVTHYRAIVGYALRRSTNPSDAADIVADTFTVAWRRLSEVPQGEDQRPWLYGVARNILANHRRGSKRREQLLERLRFELPAESVEILMPAESNEIRTALNSLRPGDRDLLRLAAWERLGPAQLALVIGCSEGAAKGRLHRARRRFEAALTAQGLGPGAGRTAEIRDAP